MPTPALLSAEDAAPLLGVSAHEVRRLCRVGLLPATRVGNQWVIRRQDAERYERGQRAR